MARERERESTSGLIDLKLTPIVRLIKLHFGSGQHELMFLSGFCFFFFKKSNARATKRDINSYQKADGDTRAAVVVRLSVSLRLISNALLCGSSSPTSGTRRHLFALQRRAAR